MPTPKDLLGHLPGGQVLDIATGTGNFIHFLLEGLPVATDIIGVDANERVAGAFAETFKDRSNVHFELGDALHLHHGSESFDLVCISNSLHHFADPLPVLCEMKRVLRPSGHLLVAEMYCDDQIETQVTHVHLHHWWAAVDTVTGILHRETYQRHKLIEMITGLGLEELALYDLSDTTEDPKRVEILTELDPVFERYIQRADGHPELQARGDELRKRVREIGFHGASTLVALGLKAKG
jgi:ubiquinone/menaquinone biosynthesis C-methylase UbiE